jgi:hypothetical protein
MMVNAIQIPSGINNEILLFVLVVLMIIFSANGIVGILQRRNESKKNHAAGTVDERRLDFEIDKFSIETIQKAVITINNDLARVSDELKEVKIELAQERTRAIELMNKNAAMVRYISKAIAGRRQRGEYVFPVDDSDKPIIPEVVAITES